MAWSRRGIRLDSVRLFESLAKANAPKERRLRTNYCGPFLRAWVIDGVWQGKEGRLAFTPSDRMVAAIRTSISPDA
jgi:hypothetical protein